MICAPATERRASPGDQGRKAASDVRTAQMITIKKISANSESVPAGAVSAVQPRMKNYRAKEGRPDPQSRAALLVRREP